MRPDITADRDSDLHRAAPPAARHIPSPCVPFHCCMLVPPTPDSETRIRHPADWSRQNTQQNARTANSGPARNSTDFRATIAGRQAGSSCWICDFQQTHRPLLAAATAPHRAACGSNPAHRRQQSNPVPAPLANRSAPTRRPATQRVPLFCHTCRFVEPARRSAARRH